MYNAAGIVGWFGVCVSYVSCSDVLVVAVTVLFCVQMIC